MRVILCLLLMVLLPSAVIYGQDTDIKKLYTDVTTLINSELLTKKNVTELSGFLYYSHFETEYDYDDRMTQQIFQVEPGFSYFFFDNISFGLSLSYSYQRTDYESSDDSKSTEQTFVGPLAKLYFRKDRFRPFVLADYLFLVGDDFEGGELDLGGGVLYHVAGNVGIDLQIKYGLIWSRRDDIDGQSRVFVGLGFSNFIL